MDCNTNKKRGRGQFIAQDYGASGVVYEVGKCLWSHVEAE